MKKNEIIRKIANDAEISQIEASKVFDAIFILFAEELENGNEVAVPGFGTFKLVASKERKGRNPKTGEEVTIKASKKVSFKVAKGLKEVVNK